MTQKNAKITKIDINIFDRKHKGLEELVKQHFQETTNQIQNVGHSTGHMSQFL